MDTPRFDRLTQSLAADTHRRGVLRALGGVLVATLLAGVAVLLTDDTSAKHKRKDHQRNGGARGEHRR